MHVLWDCPVYDSIRNTFMVESVESQWEGGGGGGRGEGQGEF